MPNAHIALRNNFVLHILPLKVLESVTIDAEVREKTALIACSGMLIPPGRTACTGSFCAVEFADTLSPDHKYAMQEEHAMLIRNYILGLSDEIKDLYICCDSGESRSPAIAAAILTASGRSDICIWKNPFYSPNGLVYQRMCAAFGICIPENDVIRKKQISEQAYRSAQRRNSASSFSRWQTIDMNILSI